MDIFTRPKTQSIVKADLDKKLNRQIDIIFVRLTEINQLLLKKKRPKILLTSLKKLRKEIGALKKIKALEPEDKKAKKLFLKLSLDYLMDTSKKISLLLLTRKELLKSSISIRKDFASFHMEF